MSDDSLARRALALMDVALEMSADARAHFLEAQERADPAVAGELRLLLSAAERDGVLDRPPAALGDDMQQAVGMALAGRYAIEGELGRGGMATVLLAHESKHNRRVVIKVLDPSIAHLFGSERFLREVRIAATLAHPHIVPLIDSGDADGFLYYVMPWMEGESLRARLTRGRPSMDEALGILRDVAGALGFAHGAGVVHRDLKPENVLLTAGHAFLLDFGIAKLLEDSPEVASLTSPGIPLGTRRYMAPEQAAGAADVDARADVYAWGVLAVELLTLVALPPVDADEAAGRLLASRGDVKGPVVALIRSCLASDPERRPTTMRAVVERLDAIITPATTPATAPRRSRALQLAGVTVAVGAAAILIPMARREVGVAPQPAEPVAMTALANETGNASLHVLGRFAADWATDGLQRTGIVRVVPWSEARVVSERAAREGTPLVTALRDQLSAGTVVTGSIYQRNDSLEFHGQLIDTRSGRVVSSLAPVVVPLDSSVLGVAQLRDRVMGAVAAMRDTRVSSLAQFASSPPSFPAYQAFDLGFEHFLGQRYRQALDAFHESFARDTTFTLALLFGARAAWNSAQFPAADSLVARARAQRSDLGSYHESVLRFLEALTLGDGASARVAIRRAASMAPNSRASYDLAASLLNAGFAREAREQLRQMDPDKGELLGWSSYWTQRAHAEYLLGAHDAEARAAREMARRFPDRRVAHVLEARALASAGNIRALDSALAAWDSLPADVYWSQGAAMVVATEELLRRGRDADGRNYGQRAVAWLSNRLVARPTDRAHRYWLGSVLYDLGEFAQAQPYFDALAREYPERLQFRGLAAVTAMRRGDAAAADRLLGSAPPRDRGEFLSFQARLAAIEGDEERAISLLTTARDAGIDGFPWLPGSAFRDLEALARTPRGRALLVAR